MHDNRRHISSSGYLSAELNEPYMHPYGMMATPSNRGPNNPAMQQARRERRSSTHLSLCIGDRLTCQFTDPNKLHRSLLPTALVMGARCSCAHPRPASHSLLRSRTQHRLVAERRWQLGCKVRAHPTQIMHELYRGLTQQGIMWKKIGPYNLKCRCAVPGLMGVGELCADGDGGGAVERHAGATATLSRARRGGPGDGPADAAAQGGQDGGAALPEQRGGVHD